MNRKIILFAAFAILAAGQVFGQNDSIPQQPAGQQQPAGPQGHGARFLWEARFDTRFDNREYNHIKRAGIVSSKTLFSLRLAPVVGVGWGRPDGRDGRGGQNSRDSYDNHDGQNSGGGRHSLMAGVSATLDMGTKLAANRPVEPLIFYNFHSKNYSAWAGKFERRHLIGNYVRAIMAGSSAFYDNVIDGFALQYHPTQGKLELLLDWDGMESATTRESFRVMSAGEWTPVKIRPMRWFTMGYSFDMYHLAGRAGAGDGVVDHMMVNPWIGVAFENLDIPLEKLSLQVGWLNSFDRDRQGANRWLMPGGATIDFTIQNWKVGIRNRLYMGDRQMPFITESFGKQIYKGDPMYHISRFYNYTQVYWRPRIAHGVTLDLEVGFHTDGKHLGFQQAAHLSVTLDNDFFKKQRPPREGRQARQRRGKADRSL